MRTIKIYAGMTGEFEIIRTDATDSIIEEQLTDNAEREDVENPYWILEDAGYTVEIIGCQYDDDLEVEIDSAFDAYDYF